MVQVKVKVNRLAFNEPKLDGKGNLITVTDKEGIVRPVMTDQILYRKGDVFDLLDIDKAEKLKRGNSIEILGRVPVVEDAHLKELEKLKKKLAEQEEIIAGMKTPSKIGNAPEAATYGSVGTPSPITHTPAKK